MAQKIKIFALILLSLATIVVYVLPAGTYAQTPCTGPVSENSNCGAGSPASGTGGPSGTQTSGDVCSSSDLTAAQLKSCNSCDSANPALDKCLQDNVIINDLQIFVNFLSALVGIVVIGTIILGGIQYASAGGSPDGVAKAKQRITNGLIAFAAFLFIFAAVQWLIPGSIFG
jgi:hypothetical protein